MYLRNLGIFLHLEGDFNNILREFVIEILQEIDLQQPIVNLVEPLVKK